METLSHFLQWQSNLQNACRVRGTKGILVVSNKRAKEIFYVHPLVWKFLWPVAMIHLNLDISVISPFSLAANVCINKKNR